VYGQSEHEGTKKLSYAHARQRTLRKKSSKNRLSICGVFSLVTESWKVVASPTRSSHVCVGIFFRHEGEENVNVNIDGNQLIRKIMKKFFLAKAMKLSFVLPQLRRRRMLSIPH
jgi:hypothetical protein